MSIIFSTGFDHYSTPTHIWNTESIGANVVAITTGGRNDTNALRMAGDGTYYLAKTLPSSIATVCVGFSFKTSALPTSGRKMTLFSIIDSGTVQCRIVLLTTGQLAVYRDVSGTNLLATGSGLYALLPNVTYHISWKTTIHNSTGTTIVKLNEVEILNATGLDTQGTANASVNQIAIHKIFESGEPSATFHYDDIVVDDANLLPDLEVRTYFPTGTGTTNQWGYVGGASVYQSVDEQVPNSDTDYATASTVSHYSLMTYPDVGSSATIYALTLLPFAEKTDAGSGTFASIFYNGSTVYDGATKAPSNSSYAYHPDIWLTNPATGVTFTATNINSGEFGFKRLS